MVSALLSRVRSMCSTVANTTIKDLLLAIKKLGRFAISESERFDLKIQSNKSHQACTATIAVFLLMVLFLQAAVVINCLKRGSSWLSGNPKPAKQAKPNSGDLAKLPELLKDVPEDKKLETIIDKTVKPTVKDSALGITRVKATDEQLKLREQQYIEAQKFSVLKTDPSMMAPVRISKYRTTIENAAKKHRVDPDTLGGLLTLESHGKTSDRSPTGPRGIAMFAKRRGWEAGLNITDTVDERLDPSKAIPAAAWALRDAYEYYGDWELAVVEYHMGRGALTKLINMYLKPRPDVGSMKQNIKQYDIKYRDIFFRNTPYHNPGTYRMIRKLTNKDWSPRYLYKVECWKRLLKLYKTDRESYVKLAKQQFYKGKARKAKMWSFFSRMEDKPLKNVGSIRKRIKTGEMVKLPNGKPYGYTIRSMGNSDPKVKNRKYYYYTKVPTAGMILYIGTTLKQLRASKGAPPAHFDISSLTRTIKYQQRLRKNNRFATKDKSFHYYGLAADIPYSSLKGKREKQDLEFILEDLYQAGMISWVRENKNCYHVVVAPDEEAREFFSDFFKSNTIEGYESKTENSTESSQDSNRDIDLPTPTPTPSRAPEQPLELLQGQAGAELNSDLDKQESKQPKAIKPKATPTPTPVQPKPKKTPVPRPKSKSPKLKRDPFKKFEIPSKKKPKANPKKKKRRSTFDKPGIWV